MILLRINFTLNYMLNVICCILIEFVQKIYYLRIYVKNRILEYLIIKL